MHTEFSPDSTSERHGYIDALRIIAILLMFIFHVAMIFVAESDWHIKNKEQSRLLLEINEWLASFRMPLLFLVSGYISYLLLKRMTSLAFIKSRFYRLIIPLVVWTFILVPPQLYLERKLDGLSFSYFEFYKMFLQFEWYPEGNFHWLHLWFIPYLFFYNILLIPFWFLLNRNARLSNCIQALFARPTGIVLFIALAAVPYAFLTVRYPATYDLIHDYARHSFFIFFVLAGFLFCRFHHSLLLVEAKRAIFFRLAFLSTIVIKVVQWNDWEPWQVLNDWLNRPQTYIYTALLTVNSWLWVMTFLGYAKKYLNAGGPILSYGNAAAYPFYLLHQTVIVIIGFYVVQTEDNAAFKFAFLVCVPFLIILASYHFFIRPYAAVRFLFGTK